MRKKEKYKTPYVEVLEIKVSQRFMENFSVKPEDPGPSAKEYYDNSLDIWNSVNENEE